MDDIERGIIKIANSKKTFTTRDVIDSLKKKYTRQYIQKIINNLVEKGKLIKKGSTKSSKYALTKNADAFEMTFREIYKNKDLQEHVIWEEIARKTPFTKGLPENIHNLVLYTFSEMLNNAIDHSKSREIQVTMENKKDLVSFVIMDFGIGVFNNIMKKNPDLKSPQEAIQELLKGKLTTDPKKHTGEGIFFTSKVCDFFALSSEGSQLKDGAFQISENSKKGTTVFCEIRKDRKDTLNDTFTKFYTDKEELDFDKTEIKIKLYTIGRACISRSQARRVLNRLENFKKVILDFDNVTTVGQGFADEVFRVYRTKHPKIEIIPINMNKSIEFMIDRAK